MSELDSGLEELRADLRAAMKRPELRAVATLARQRDARRNVQISAIVAVVLVVLAAPLLRSVPAKHTATPPQKSPRQSYQVDFADAEQGYALVSDCAKTCSFTLLTTSDGGVNWRAGTLPVAGGQYTSGSVYVFGPNQLMFSVAGSGGQLSQEHISDDAGRTWRRFAGLEPGASGVIPSGAKLMRVCLNPNAGNDCTLGFGAINAGKGELSPTPAQPPLVGPTQAGTDPIAGSLYWAVGKYATSARWAISVTSDQGVSWSTTELDVPGTPAMSNADAWAVVVQHGAMYATVRGAVQDGGPNGLLAVFQSTDSGVTWDQTWHATTEKLLPGVTGSPIATTDGRLIVYSPTEGTLESTDGGKTFRQSLLRLTGPVTWTRGGYLVQRPKHSWGISQDGVHWRNFRLP